METLFDIGFDQNKVVRSFFEAGEAGKKASADIEQGFRRASTSTNAFTQFVRQQRIEQRNQNFVMRETIQSINGISAAMLTLNNSMGSTSDSTKELTTAITHGFLAFQGLEFALSALGAGPWGVAVAAATGLVVAFSSMAATSREAAKQIAAMNSRLVELQFATGRMNVRRFVDEQRNQWQSAKQDLDFYMASGEKDLKRLAELQIAEAEAYKKYQDAQKAFSDFRKNRSKEDQDDLKQTRTLIDGNANALANSISMLRAYTRLVAPELFKDKKVFKFDGIADPNNTNRANALKDLKQAFERSDFKTNIIKDFENIGFAGANAAHAIAGSMQTTAAMMTDAFFGASIRIEDIFKNMFQNIVQMAMESLLKSGIMSLLGLLLAPATGGTSLIATAGWDALNLKKNASVSQRTQVAKMVREALAKEKL